MIRALAALAVTVTLLAGCGGSSSSEAASDSSLPAEETFADGPCRNAAPDILAIGRTLPRLDKKGTLDQEVRDTLRDAQAVLAAIAAGAPSASKPALSDLADKAGLVRSRADANSYEKAQGEQLRSSYEAAVKACTAPAG